VKEEEEEVDLESLEREENNNLLKPKSQQKQPQLDLFVNIIFKHKLKVDCIINKINASSNAEDI